MHYPPPFGEEPSYPERPQDPGETRLSGVQQVIITAIRATDPIIFQPKQ